MKILLASDAWPPQVNGVVRTMLSVTRELEGMGHNVAALTPQHFTTIPCPFYQEIRLALNPSAKIASFVEAVAPDAIHIVTEGPIGLATRRWCLNNGYHFTTAYHTRFPEYLAVRYVAPRRMTYALLRRFHAPSQGVMVATDSVRSELAERGFTNLVPWGRGVDPSLFDPSMRSEISEFPRPIFLSVGRVAQEKNLPAFLSLDLPGSKVIVGEGPALASLQRRFPDAHFIGRRENAALARLYASADVFGLPVAAYPVPGPLDVIGQSGAGALDEDLGRAALAALNISRERCREHALSYTWTNCARQFLEQLSPIH
jgi:glycosyltransferase involved in cell wall biosynthesis